MFRSDKKGHIEGALDPLLRPIAPRACYGVTAPADNRSSVLLVGDDEFVVSTGSNLRVYNDVTQSSHLLSPQIPNCVSVTSAVLSRDRKLLTVVVKETDQDPTGGAGTSVVTMNAITGNKVVEEVHWVKGQTACVHVYDMAAQMAHRPKKPKTIMYKPEKWQDSWPALRFTSVAISRDNCYIAVSTNVPELGTFLYDAMLGALVVKLATTKLIKDLSFYPEDSTKLCAIGLSNTISMWRISNNNNAYVSPAHGLASVPHNDFTCLTWLDKGDDGEQRLLVGSSLGYIVLIQGIDQIQPVTWAFGAPPGYGVPHNEGFKEGGIAQILTRGDIAIAVSDSNMISIMEIKKYGASGGTGSTAVLIPLRRYEVGAGIKKITGMCWASLTVTSSYTVCVSTPMALHYLDTEADSLGSKAGIETGMNASGVKAGAALTYVAKKGEYIGGTYSGAQAKPLLGEAPGCDVSWDTISPSRLMTNFHSGSINALSMSTRTSLLVTSSAADESLRVVDFANQTGPCFSVADFSGDRRGETANYTDMHPSGTIFAAACEDEALELIMADTGLETVRRIPTKVPYTLPNGTPFVNMHPVSIVRYSHSGHLLAVVTHKHAQIFHMYDYKVNATDCTTQPTLVMALMDHTAAITDICFAHDDKTLYTSAADGTVYSWVIGDEKRHADYVHKALPATKVCCDDSGFVVAAYTPDLQTLREEAKLASMGFDVGGNNSAGPSGPGTPFGQFASENGLASGAGGGRNRSRRASVASTPPSSRASRRGSLSSNRGGGFATGLLGIGDNSTHDNLDESKVRIRPQSMVVCWEDEGLELNHSNAKTFYVDGGILSMALGRIDSGDRDRVCVLGLHDGRVIVSLLPFPTHIINASHLHALVTSAGMAAQHSHSGGVGARQDQKWAQQVQDHLPGASPLINSQRRSPARNTFSGATMSHSMESATGSIVETPGIVDDDNISVHSLNSRGSIQSQAFTRGGSVNTNSASAAAAEKVYLLERRCKILQLHGKGVTSLSISISGLWIFSAGEDGVVYMLATSVRAREISEVPEKSRALENNYVLTDKEQLTSIRARISETDQMILDKTRESDRIINKLMDENHAKVTELENRMKREMAKRDEIIIKTREDMIRTSKNLNKQLSDVENIHTREMSKIESEYEKRLSKENLYLHKMRQAYDEFVLHARMDMQDFQKEVEKKKEMENSAHIDDLKDQEKQKEALLAYIEYVKGRNQEIISALDGAQDEERHRSKIAVEEANNKTEEAAQAGRSEIARLTIDVQKAKHAITKKEDDLIRVSSDLGWANERIKKLEMALQEATSGLSRQTEVAEKWEFRSGEQTQQIYDLERIRKALTSQLHGLRQEVGPEKEKLSQVSDRLSEVDREYELSLQSVSEKEAEIVRRGGTITNLHKQVKEMRYTTSQKERALSRAAKVLGEYKVALKESEFDAVKRTVPKGAIAPSNAAGTLGNQKDDDEKSVNSAATPTNNANGNNDGGLVSTAATKKGAGSKGDSESELVEVIKRSGNMNSALRRLEEILLPFELGAKNIEVDDEVTQALVERERHVTQLHQQVHTLRSSLHSTEETAMVKVKKSLGDNQVLLEEVNGMRHRIKKQTMEIQRQKATIDMLHIRMGINTGDDDGPGGQMGSMSGSYDGSPGTNNMNNGSMNRTHSTTVSVPNVKYSGTHMYSRDPNDMAYQRGSQSSEDLTRGGGGLMDNAGSGEITLSRYLLAEQGHGQGQQGKEIPPRLEDPAVGNERPSADVNPLPRDHYQPPYSSGGGMDSRPLSTTADAAGLGSVQPESDRDREKEEDEERRRLRAETLAAVNQTTIRAEAAIKKNKTQSKTSTSNSSVVATAVDDGLPIEDSISSLKTADEKIAAIMAENDRKIREMRDQSSAQDILTYYQKKLGDVDVPPRSADKGADKDLLPSSSQAASRSRERGPSSTSSRRSNTKSKGGSRAASSTGASMEEKNGGGTGTASVYRPLSKSGPALRQGEINSSIQLPDIKA